MILDFEFYTAFFLTQLPGFLDRNPVFSDDRFDVEDIINDGQLKSKKYELTPR